jgi:phage terminase large subunit
MTSFDPKFRASVLSPASTTQQVQVSLPHLFTPRDYQRDDLFRPLFPHHYPDLRLLSVPRKKRICMVHHRRAGKDISVLNALTLAAYEEYGSYLYLLPEQTQGRKIVWRGLSSGDVNEFGEQEKGKKFLDYIPKEIIKKKFEAEMLVELINGSTIQVGGADNYDSFMGTNPRGIVFSEYSLMNPVAWQYFRPILVENGGWAVFIYTARGKNHGHTLYEIAKKSPEVWAYSLRTIEDTRKPDGSPVVTIEQYEEEIRNGMDPAIARQEFYCDFNAALIGSYYGDLIEKAKKDKRTGFFPYDPAYPVYVAYDLGNDMNVAIFAQKDGDGVRIIDYFGESNTPFTEMLKVVCAKSYTYGAHFFPHDVKNRDHESNTRVTTAENMGIDPVVTPKYGIDDGIESVRNMLPRVRFNTDSDDVETFVDAVASYERVWDDRMKVFHNRPLHNYASHPADALRCLAMNIDEVIEAGSSWLNEELEGDDGWMT